MPSGARQMNTHNPSIRLELVTVAASGDMRIELWPHSHHISAIMRRLNQERRDGKQAWMRVNGRDVADADIGEAILMAVDEGEQDRCG